MAEWPESGTDCEVFMSGISDMLELEPSDCVPVIPGDGPGWKERGLFT